MRHFGRWGPAMPVLIALASLAAPATGRAGFVMTLEEAGFSNLVVNDGDPLDQDPTTGKIRFLGSFGDFTVQTSAAGTSNRTTPGTGDIAQLQITDLAVRNNSGAQKTLSILLSDTNFTFPGGTGSPMTLRSSIGGTFLGALVGDSFTFQSFADNNNVLNGTQISTDPLTFTSPGGVQTSFSGNNTIDFTRGGTYSLSNSSTFTLSAGGQLNPSGTTSVIGSSGSGIAGGPVPEPGSLALGALGFLTAGVWGGLRRLKKNS
jgi:hypothetical protein